MLARDLISARDTEKPSGAPRGECEVLVLPRATSVITAVPTVPE